MTIWRVVVAGAGALAISTSVGHAGACMPQIDAVQVRIEAWLKENALRLPTAAESSGARLHRQPTPRSVEDAESKLQELSAHKLEALKSALARAREADRAGDLDACEEALADALRLMAP